MKKLLAWSLALFLGLAPAAVPATGAPPGGVGGYPASASVDIRGKLEPNPLGPEVPSPTGWCVRVGDETFWVDFGGNKELLGKAASLAGRRVQLRGDLEMRLDPTVRERACLRPVPFVHVTSTEALADPAAGDAARVTLYGKLICGDGLDIAPPILLGEVQVGKQTFALRIKGEQLLKQATGLNGQMVQVSGTLQNGTVVVTGFWLPLVGC
jgi:hypothetical protein